MTKKEYGKLLDDKETAEVGRDNALIHVERQLNEAKLEAVAMLRKVEQEAAQRLEKAQKELAAARKDAAFQRGLNANLLRMSKERANAERKLKPKKEHTGYVVVSSAEKEYRYRVRGQREPETVTLWETVMQSPYTVDFIEEQAEKLIAEDLAPKDAAWLVGKIGVTGSYPGKYEELIRETKTDDEFMQRNIMLSRSLRANFRTGYWEIFFLHTKPLGIVPADMRAK